MKAHSYQSGSGPTGSVSVEDEEYVIVRKGETKLGIPEITIDIDYRRRLLKIYDNGKWTVLPMNKDSQVQDIRVIKHIDELRK